MKLIKKLGIRLPIIQAPMAGSIVTPTMIAAVTRAGGLGSLPLGYLNLQQVQKLIQETKRVVRGNFAVNIFLPTQDTYLQPAQITTMLTHINYYRSKLGLPHKEKLDAPLIEANIDELINLIIKESIPIISFTFGTLSQEKIIELHKKNIIVIGTATTVQESQLLESLGCDAVVAQGYEAGGHRGGGFVNTQSGGLIGTMALVPQMASTIKIPVIAAGGIMDGRGIAAALALGASAVQLGTAFLTCTESAAAETHKQVVLHSAENSTCITSSFTGKPARALNNDFIRDTESKFSADEIPPYSIQHQLTTEFRVKAAKLGQVNYGSFWMGQGSSLSRSTSVKGLMEALEMELDEAVLALSKKTFRSK